MLKLRRVASETVVVELDVLWEWTIVKRKFVKYVMKGGLKYRWKEFVDVFHIRFYSGLPPQRQVEVPHRFGSGASQAPMSFVKKREAWSSLKLGLNLLRIVKPLTSLTERDQKYEWGAERKEAFQTLKNDLCDASINQMKDTSEDLDVFRAMAMTIHYGSMRNDTSRQKHPPETESDEVIKSSVENLIPIPSESEGIPDKMCDVPLGNNPTPLNALNEHYEIVVNSDDDNSSSDDDSPYGENIDYVDASPPDVEIVSLEVVEIVDPEVGRIDDDILLTIKDDILREKLLNVNLLIAKIDSLRDNPTPSSEVVIKSTSTFPNLFLEETNTFDNSIPESETFRFNLEEISSGSPTTHSELSLPDYKAFYVDNDHFKERSSGSTTTHVDFSQYDSFIFDLSNDQFPPTDRSDFYHEEFADELAHIISPPEYDHFCFKIEPELGNLTMDVVNDIFPTREPRVHVPNVLPTHPTLDTDFILLSEPLFAYIVWIFLPFLTYPVAPPYLLSCGNEDIIFDPGISNYHSFMPDVSHRSGTFMKFNVYPNHLNESPMEILSSTCSPMDQ
ncbi:hypothetical protein Tco_0601990 [Tanacetum coccineum]